LLRLSAQTPDPRWSSAVLEALVEAFLRTPGSQVGDLMAGLADLWQESATPLTPQVAAFIKDITVLCFTRHRTSYQDSDFGPLTDALARNPSAAIAYLALLALPDPQITAAKPAILAGLADTGYAEDAAGMLSDLD
jgi:hypothetical protein